MNDYNKAVYAKKFLKNCKKTLALLVFYDIICVNKMNDDVYNEQGARYKRFYFYWLLTGAK